MAAPLHLTKHHARAWRARLAGLRLESAPRNHAAGFLNSAAANRRAGQYAAARRALAYARDGRARLWAGLAYLP